MTPVSSPASTGLTPLRTVQVTGGSAVGSTHVRSLTAGLVARGVRVTVCAPSDTEHTYGFAAVGARHVPVARSSDPASVAALRVACADADVVHAHGLHASFRTALALGGRSTPLVVTWHNRTRAEGAARAAVLKVLERRVVRAAAVVLGVSSSLVDRARRRGARDARLSAVGLPRALAAGGAARAVTGAGGGDGDLDRRAKLRAELGSLGRPLILAVGALEEGRGHRLLLDAARRWRDEENTPLVVVAGEGALRGELQRRIEDEALPVRLLGRREDLGCLLTAADVAVVADCAEGRSLLAQEALHAGLPLVAADVPGMAELVGDGAELVPAGDAARLAHAVSAVLADPSRREGLVRRGAWQAGVWPTEDETVAQVLSVYDELTQPLPLA
ncbi:glycosyltransferase family 4 protein [Streptomyces abyssomicinicus]|uniref:glycosyltransferase family 4 protein n=1 Tax=Streptomyces abyssomicinicus TaxID=574929 RepID=UPI0012509D3E|nr:glycosyltransferase family 4 protein [Streptomyces abyssomicinicus]